MIRRLEAVDAILGGWQLSGIFTAETGTPFSALMACADVNAEGNNCRPNRIASGELPSGSPPSQNGSIQRICDPSPPAFGNSGRNILRGPRTAKCRFRVIKSFLWGRTETRRLQIRAEFFNALNHTNLGLPVNSIDSPALGTITSAASARVIQLGARMEF